MLFGNFWSSSVLYWSWCGDGKRVRCADSGHAEEEAISSSLMLLDRCGSANHLCSRCQEKRYQWIHCQFPIGWMISATYKFCYKVNEYLVALRRWSTNYMCYFINLCLIRTILLISSRRRPVFSIDAITHPLKITQLNTHSTSIKYISQSNDFGICHIYVSAFYDSCHWQNFICFRPYYRMGSVFVSSVHVCCEDGPPTEILPSLYENLKLPHIFIQSLLSALYNNHKKLKKCHRWFVCHVESCKRDIINVLVHHLVYWMSPLWLIIFRE